MRSVADTQREALQRESTALTVEQRVERAFLLGDDDLASYASVQAVTLDSARRALIRRRRIGRPVSGCIESLTS